MTSLLTILINSHHTCISIHSYEVLATEDSCSRIVPSPSNIVFSVPLENRTLTFLTVDTVVCECRYILYLRRWERKKEREKEEEKEIVVVIMMSCVVAIEGQCGCSVLIFICTRQVGTAIPATLSDVKFHINTSQNLVTLVRRLEES